MATMQHNFVKVDFLRDSCGAVYLKKILLYMLSSTFLHS